MPTMGGVSGNALASLTAVDSWIRTLNSSVGGAARTGYKTSKITFGGGTTRLDKPAQSGALPIQYAEQALTVGATNIDFSEGQVVASTEFTHFALSGSQNAFFTLFDRINGDDPDANATYFATRDGEFHVDAAGFLRTVDGLYVAGQNNAGAMKAIRIDPNATDPEGSIATVIDNHNLNDTTSATNIAGLNIETMVHYFENDLQSLEFSKYGSTVFDLGTAVPAMNLSVAGTNTEKVKINGNSLEASNVQLPSSLVELSLAQKIYSALTKVIQIDQQKLDSTLNLIR